MMIQVNPPRGGTWRGWIRQRIVRITLSVVLIRACCVSLSCFLLDLPFQYDRSACFNGVGCFLIFFSFKDGAKWGVRIETAQELQPEQRRRHGLGEETTTAAREWGKDAKWWLRQPASFGCRYVVGGDDYECEKKIWGSERWWW
jgi:hypothetical protein